MRFILLISLLSLTACSQPKPILDRLPVQVAECPDPEERAGLLEGSTWRDLARSRAEALTGWEECWNAARENGAALEGVE